MFYIDTTRKQLEIFQYAPEDYAEDLLEYGIRLDCPDWRVFEKEEDAEAWLSRYRSIRLSTEHEGYPCMLLKRRYIVQTAMQVKTCTRRHYRKNWQPGQRFYFHDQTYFLLCELVGIEKEAKAIFRYDFRLVT